MDRREPRVTSNPRVAEGVEEGEMVVTHMVVVAAVEDGEVETTRAITEATHGKLSAWMVNVLGSIPPSDSRQSNGTTYHNPFGTN